VAVAVNGDQIEGGCVGAGTGLHPALASFRQADVDARRPRGEHRYRIHRVRLDVVEFHITDREHLRDSGVAHQHLIDEHNPA
jgi:hypothetical protein